MNWYPNLNTQQSNDYINTNIYNGLVTQGEGIDLRQELNWILYGKNTYPPSVPKGHWVVLRKFDRTQKSSYYNELTHEGVGGPAYKYTDTLLRTRKVPLDRRGQPLDPLKVGIDIENRYIYYFEYTVNPKIGDHIFEIEWPDHKLTPKLNSSLIYNDKYNIKRVHDYRLENGNIQYYLCSVEFDEVSY